MLHSASCALGVCILCVPFRVECVVLFVQVDCTMYAACHVLLVLFCVLCVGFYDCLVCTVLYLMRYVSYVVRHIAYIVCALCILPSLFFAYCYAFCVRRAPWRMLRVTRPP